MERRLTFKHCFMKEYSRCGHAVTLCECDNSVPHVEGRTQDSGYFRTAVLRRINETKRVK
jgi:hypothetical protein